MAAAQFVLCLTATPPEADMSIINREFRQKVNHVVRPGYGRL